MAGKQIQHVPYYLICPVCCEVYKKPKCLPCYHSCCEQCLAKLQEDSKVKCPTCSKTSIAPAGGVTELPSNFFIDRIVAEIALTEKVTGKEDVNCDICVRSDLATVFCFDCSAFLCDHCQESHKYCREYQGHHMRQLQELRAENNDINVNLKPRPLYCQEHELELSFYCETCKQLVCHYCITKAHLNHKHNTAKDVANKYRIEMDEIMEPVHEMINELYEVCHKVTVTSEKIQHQTIEAEKQIDRYYKKLLRRLHRQRLQLKNELYEVSTCKQREFSLRLNELEDALAQLEGVNELSVAVKYGSDQEALLMKKQVTKDATNVANRYNFRRFYIKPDDSVNMQFIPVAKYHKWFPQFGNVFYGNACAVRSEARGIPSCAYINELVDFEIWTKNADNKICYEEGNKVVVEAESSAGDFIPVTVDDREDGSYSPDFRVDQLGKIKLSVIIEGKHMKGSPYNILVCRDYYKLDSFFTKVVDDNGKMGNPWGIAFDKDGMLAVADHSNHCVCIFDGQDQVVKKFGSKGKGNGEFNSPTALAFDDDNNLFVVDKDNRRVQKFNAEGKYLLEFGRSRSLLCIVAHDEAGCDELGCPVGIAIHNDKVFIADQGKRRITVFQCNGNFCYNIVLSKVLSEPCDVAININDHLLVADRGHHCIVILTLGGFYVNTIGTEVSGKGKL